MIFAKLKKNFINSKKNFYSQPPDHSVTESELLSVNEEIYKRNVELAEKNKLLSLLHRLYAIITRSLELNELSTNIVQTIVSSMGFPVVGIFLIDEDKKQLVPIAGFSSDKISAQLFDNNKKISINHTMSKSILVKAYKTNKREQTSKLHDVLEPFILKEHSFFFDTKIPMGHVMPLVNDKRPLGVLCVGMHLLYKDLSSYEKESITNIINIARIALDKALIYEELKRANLRLQELDRQKTEFLSIASHQLRTPLSIIKGYIELIQDGAYGKITQKAFGILRDMDESNEHLIKLVDEFLNISRIEQNRTKFSFEKAVLSDLISNVYKELQIKAKNKRLELLWAKDETVDDTVMMDAEKIRHVIYNFVDNAIKYSERGDVLITAVNEDSGIAVRVKDQGLGFNKEDEINFFQKFYRGKNVDGVNVNGTGLGIYVCKKFIEAHNGKVWAKSPGLGNGSEFGFWIPLKQR